jgi:hypothetical protein
MFDILVDGLCSRSSFGFAVLILTYTQASSSCTSVICDGLPRRPWLNL